MQEQVSVIELYDYITKEKLEEPSVQSRSLFLRGNVQQRRNQSAVNPFRVVDILRSSRNSFTIKTLKGNTRNVTSFSYSRLPNQIKSLYLRKTQNNHDAVTGEFLEGMFKNYNFDGALEYKFTIGKLARIRYLAGYRRNRRGELSAKSPIWVTLTKRVYDRLSGKSVVCMIDSYENRAFDYSQTAGLDVNIYNKYFILDIQRDAVAVDTEQEISAEAEDGRGQPLTQRRDQVAAAEGDDVEAEGAGAEGAGQRVRELADMTPQEISEIDLNKYSDDEISKLNALQLASVPISRRNRLARRKTRVSRNNLMCVSMAEENESEEFTGANARTSTVPNRSMRQTDRGQKDTPANAQSGDVY
jgi:hypothetical protein